MKSILKREKIGIIGCGNMGEALIRGLLSSGRLSPNSLFASDCDSRKRKRIKRLYRIGVFGDNCRLVGKSSVVILAVKPETMSSVLEEISALSSTPLFISIAAGITTRFIEDYFPRPTPVIRVMPNAPALVGGGISALSRGRSAKPQARKISRAIFESVGEVVECKERLLDAVTALSGSGPAYFYYLLESLVRAGKRIGLKKELAEKLVRETAFGALRLLEETGERPEKLRARVTSRGGTTKAAISVFEKRKFASIVAEALAAACQRAAELQKG